MKVALIGEPLWLTHESVLLRHLVFGLSDEFVRVLPVVPEDAALAEMPGVTEQLRFRPSGIDLLMKVRMRRLADRLREAEVGLIHVLDGEISDAARALAETCELPLAVSCWSAGQLRTVLDWGEQAAMVMPASSSMADDAADREMMRVVRPGVLRRADDTPPPLRAADQMLCVLVMVEGRPDATVSALMEAVAQVRRSLPQLQVFIYPVDGEAHRAWLTASKLNLLSQVSMVGPEGGSADLLTQVDAIVLPQGVQRVWTLPLSGMAAGRPVVAPPSPLADYLIPGRTCEPIDSPATAAAWADLLQALARRPEHFVHLGRSARDYVREHHGIGRFVADVLEVYRQTSGEPLKFEEQP